MRMRLMSACRGMGSLITQFNGLIVIFLSCFAVKFLEFGVTYYFKGRL